jgi:O-antigen/teichoic acid export membrane protein
VSEDSLAKRYGFKLGASLLGLPLSLAQQWVVTRALGPAGYGSYSFLNSFFSEVIAFFDSGTSAGFYAKLCGRPEEKGLVAFYWKLAGAITAVLFIGVAVVLLAGLAP